MTRYLVLGFGVVCYAIFFAAFLYMIGFLGNFAVPKSIDSPNTSSLGTALAIDLALIGFFAVHHSVAARPWFKQWLTRLVPAPIERSTYVLGSALALILLFWLWQPTRGNLWDFESTFARSALHGLFAIGWLTILGSTFLLNHFDLFGLRQVWLYFCDQKYTPLKFITPGPYRFVRHPLYVGWLLTFWATPTMSIIHLLFALGMTAYILVAIPLEERDLVKFLGKDYAAYRRRVPMFVPRLGPPKN